MPSYKDSKVTDAEVEMLLAEERDLRSKQPEAWTKTKYRRYSNFGCNQRKTDSLIKAATKSHNERKIPISNDCD